MCIFVTETLLDFDQELALEFAEVTVLVIENSQRFKCEWSMTPLDIVDAHIARLDGVKGQEGALKRFTEVRQLLLVKGAKTSDQLSMTPIEILSPNSRVRTGPVCVPPAE